jgi:hypothetical protein
MVMPIDCMAKPKFRATSGGILKMSVMTGKATAPPPSALAPAIKEPKTIVRDMNQYS